MLSGDMEKSELIRQTEDAIDQAAHNMDKAMQRSDLAQLKDAAEAWRRAQELWLQAAQNMTPEKAHAIMVEFATGGALSRWQEQQLPGPPPDVRSLYKES